MNFNVLFTFVKVCALPTTYYLLPCYPIEEGTLAEVYLELAASSQVFGSCFTDSTN